MISASHRVLLTTLTFGALIQAALLQGAMAQSSPTNPLPPTGKATPIPTATAIKGRSLTDYGLPNTSKDYTKAVSLEVGPGGIPFDLTLSTLIRAIGYTPVLKDLPKTPVTNKFKNLPFNQIVPLLLSLYAPELELKLLPNKVILAQGKVMAPTLGTLISVTPIPPVKLETKTLTLASSLDYQNIISLLGGRSTRTGRSYVIQAGTSEMLLIEKTLTELESNNVGLREQRTLSLPVGEVAGRFLAPLRNLFPDTTIEPLDNKLIVSATPSRIAEVAATLDTLRDTSSSTSQNTAPPVVPVVVAKKALRYYSVGARAADFAGAIKIFFSDLPSAVSAGQLIVQADEVRGKDVDALIARLLESAPTVAAAETPKETPTLRTYTLGSRTADYARLITLFYPAKAEIGGELLVVQAGPSTQIQIEDFLKSIPPTATQTPAPLPSAPQRVSRTYPILGPSLDVETAVKAAFPALTFVRLPTLGSFAASGIESELIALEGLLSKVNVIVQTSAALTQTFALQGSGIGLTEALGKFLPEAKTTLNGSNLVVEASGNGILRAANLVAALDRPVPKAPEAPVKVTVALPLSNGKAESVAGQLKALVGADVVVVADARTNTILVTAHSNALESLRSTVSELDKQVAQASLRVQITQIDVTAAQNLGLDWKALAGGIGISTARSIVGGDLTKLDLTLTALAQNGRSRTLTDSSFLVTSNQITKLVSGGTVLLPKTSSSSTSGSSGSISQSVSGYETQNFGLDIQLEPQIGVDGTITLGVKTSLGRAPIAGANGSLQFPAQTFSSQIRFKSGKTVVFGGVVGSSTSESKSGVPVLKDLPLIGNLFGTTVKSRSTQALLIVIRGESAIVASEANQDFAKKIQTP